MGPYFMKSYVPIESPCLSMEVPISLGNSDNEAEENDDDDDDNDCDDDNDNDDIYKAGGVLASECTSEEMFS